MFDPIITSHPVTGAQRRVTTELLGETYLVARHAPADLAALMADQDAPWAESLANAPRETVDAVGAGLRDLMLATGRLDPDEVDPSRLPAGSRLRQHVQALLALWRRMGDGLPRDLQVMRHVLHSDGSDAIEQLPIVETGDAVFASRAEAELRAVLLRHHGPADEAATALWRARRDRVQRGGAPGTSLAHAQRALATPATTPMPLDDTLAFWGLRDLAQEAEVAAAMAQRLIDGGAAAQGIALLVPDDAACHRHLDTAFAAAGVPLSGLPRTPALRDVATETLPHFLLALNAPAPAMVLASLYVSPLMPWPAATGAALARAAMQGRFDPGEAKALEGRSQRLFKTLREARPGDGAAVSALLDRLAQGLNEADEWQDQAASLRARLPGLKALLAAGAPPDWDRLLDSLTPATPRPEPGERFVEGVSVFAETAAPWRPAEHLIVLGAATGRYPRASSASPLFVDSELDQLAALTGLRLPGRSRQIARGLELFRRQFLAARKSCTFLVPLRGLDGRRQAGATVLGLVARTIRDPAQPGNRPVEDPETMVRELRATPRDDWPCAARPLKPLANGAHMRLPADGCIRLGRDLFMLRRDSGGHARRQSPSRLEKLLISPLAWTLAEAGAQEVIWAPETLGPALAGTLAHDVLEHLFVKNRPLPAQAEIERNVGRLLTRAIRSFAPFLLAPIWQVERQGLKRDILRDAVKWRAFLDSIGAQVLENELDIRGDALGLNLCGRADCLVRLPDGRLLIVDHKKAGTAKRRERMQAGWDLQLGLYRAMLQRPDLDDGVLKEVLADRPEIGVAYHLINDSGVLVHGIALEAEGAAPLDNDISAEAIDLLRTRIAQVGAGNVVVNSPGDVELFEKKAKMKPYALEESTLVAAAMAARGMQERGQGGAPDGAPDGGHGDG